ncbi:hypothetical protein UAY_02469 [Enterococcus moraviensis ATCC BAA-383]|uniref:HD/PDEase domain-containing protein n=1 Tax=Enterococcus moraviensis ATCC BAA-383 TaxID=1158609 RepID=R2QQ10_9ENTE|nr:HD domain-containing protein [Enterococcus moraviensis]EOH97313.1 hypothetical protein UAY_02469 [Enterococcus moraviensis ATCC BAA-383]EOT71627.1 hypothetical protein I586_01434 [Enterococcus moraviensis ATCC BAA-383]OJG66698.1 hypothetical protein RV09_GL000845 [Enterococcus moraviensis]
MIVEDILYGSFEVEEVLAVLISSQEVQRLKDVHMAGPAFLINPSWNETRYEHSIGVMLLVKKLGGTVEEQIAGLLHDVSHTAFSHVIDLVLSNKADDYHEQIKKEFIEQSTIPELLEQYGFDYQQILFDDEQWRLLEQKAPLLCCDRIDYTLREVHRYFSVPLQEIHDFLKAIKIMNDQIVLESVAWAVWFVDQYQKVVLDFFYDPRNICSYEWMAKAIQLGLSNGEITMTDLLLTDAPFLQKLRSTRSTEINFLLAKIQNPPKYSVCSSEDEYDIEQKKKIRFVDPLVRLSDEIVSVSAISKSAQLKIDRVLEESQKGIYIKYD